MKCFAAYQRRGRQFASDCNLNVRHAMVSDPREQPSSCL